MATRRKRFKQAQARFQRADHASYYRKGMPPPSAHALDRLSRRVQNLGKLTVAALKRTKTKLLKTWRSVGQ